MAAETGHQVAGDQPKDPTADVPVASFGDHWKSCEKQQSADDRACFQRYQSCMSNQGGRRLGPEYCWRVYEICLEGSRDVFKECYGPHGPQPF